MMGYGGSCGGAGIKIQGSGRIPPKYSSSSSIVSPSPFYTEQLIHIHPRFPGKREILKTQALPSTSSTWTLVDPEVRLDRHTKPRPDPLGQDTQDVDEPGLTIHLPGTLDCRNPNLRYLWIDTKLRPRAIPNSESGGHFGT